MKTTTAETFPERFKRVGVGTVINFTNYRITMVEHLLDRADWSDDAVRLHLLGRYGKPEQIDLVIKLHDELLTILPPDAVPSLDEQDEYEARAYELHTAIKELVTAS